MRSLDTPFANRIGTNYNIIVYGKDVKNKIALKRKQKEKLNLSKTI